MSSSLNKDIIIIIIIIIMRHSSRRLAPSWALLCSQISVEPYSPKGPENVK